MSGLLSRSGHWPSFQPRPVCGTSVDGSQSLSRAANQATVTYDIPVEKMRVAHIESTW